MTESGTERTAGAWVEDPQTAIDLINVIEWSPDDDSMLLLRELSMVATGDRDRIRFEIGDCDV